MSSGYYAACAGLRAQTEALDLIANNLANVNTPGYRSQDAAFQSLLAGSYTARADPLSNVVNDFNAMASTHLQMQSGNLQQTGNPLDLAIKGPGFFAVQTPAGTMYTRDGNFQVSARGQLITARGEPVLGATGPITLPAGELTFSPDGTISTNGAVAGQVRIVEFKPGARLVAEGNSLYSVSANGVQPSPSSSLRQGELEASNVDPVRAVVSLIMTQRQAEMMERCMSTFESDFDHIAANDLPKV